ncbi:MAG TPA: ABC transporter ATP-binding protein [Blastocatellia bacterium]|nr:ABC transporter ATP-binding protein [Blastocatellia bacterium]
MDGPFVRLINVRKRFGDRVILKGVSLDVAQGEVVALLGASGSGKTTTIRIIAGLEKPDEGEVWIESNKVAADGQNLVQPSKRGIGFVFQDLALWPHLTITESLDFVLSSADVPKRERADRISEVLRLVRIESLGQSYPGQLSGGEQQRAAIARALISRPRLLLLDEPMSNLDARLKSDLLKEFAALRRMLNITTIYITHDESEASTLANRIIVMREGQITPAGMMNNHTKA